VELESEPYPKRRVDAMTGVMMLVTLVALACAGWLRFGRSPSPETTAASVGAEAPPLHLIDPETSKPVVLGGLNDKVVWLVFWSAASPSGPSCLANVQKASRRLRMHRRFALVVAAVGVDDPTAVRAAARGADFQQPVYLAGPETRSRFHAENVDPPLHVLMHTGGRILAMARGEGDPTVGRLAEQAQEFLDEIDPDGEMRVASARPHQP
jgi:hypothetical protein